MLADRYELPLSTRSDAARNGTAAGATRTGKCHSKAHAIDAGLTVQIPFLRFDFAATMHDAMRDDVEIRERLSVERLHPRQRIERGVLMIRHGCGAADFLSIGAGEFVGGVRADLLEFSTRESFAPAQRFFEFDQFELERGTTAVED